MLGCSSRWNPPHGGMPRGERPCLAWATGSTARWEESSFRVHDSQKGWPGLSRQQNRLNPVGPSLLPPGSEMRHFDSCCACYFSQICSGEGGQLVLSLESVQERTPRARGQRGVETQAGALPSSLSWSVVRSVLEPSSCHRWPPAPRLSSGTSVETKLSTCALYPESSPGFGTSWMLG